VWFRNLQIFQLTQAFDLDPESLHQILQSQRFKPCYGLDTQSLGWVSPLGQEHELLTHAANGCVMICARLQERVLPSAVIKESLDEKVAKIESTENREVYRKEKRRIKDEIMVDLLPRAFTKSQLIYAYIDPGHQLILVDSTSQKRAEELMSLLRRSLGSLKAIPLAVNKAPAKVFTSWLMGTRPVDFQLGDECEMREQVSNGGILRCRYQELQADEITQHIRAGKQVVKLALEWGERLSCVVADDLSIKRLKFLSLIQDEADDTADDALARFDAEFALMSLELSRFINRLVELLGGYEKSATVGDSKAA